MNRRAFLGSTAAAALSTGCLGSGNDNSSPESVTPPDDLPSGYQTIPDRRLIDGDQAAREDVATVAPDSWVYTDEIPYLDKNDIPRTVEAGSGNVFMTVRLLVWNPGGETVTPPGAEQFGLINTKREVVPPSMELPGGIEWGDTTWDDVEHPLHEPTFVSPNTYYFELEKGTSFRQPVDRCPSNLPFLKIAILHQTLKSLVSTLRLGKSNLIRNLRGAKKRVRRLPKHVEDFLVAKHRSSASHTRVVDDQRLNCHEQ